MNKDYISFLEKKKHSIGNMGFEATYYPDISFDFQREIINRATNKGRMAIFADTGMGKTLIQLSLSMNVISKTNKKVLILTPLAVAFQFIKEAEKLGISDIEYSKDGKHKSKIVICNYERLHYFDSKDFEAVILDESSILKNFDGKIKNSITSFIKKVNYRYLSTATPSPNDFIELGTSSEALGYMGYTDMLGRFFKNNSNSLDPKHAGDKWYLKPHAEKDFFAWVNQWAVMLKMPSDLGFSNDRYVLPELKTITHTVESSKALVIDDQFEMFARQAKGFNEVRQEVKQTIQERCEKAAELAQNKISVYWCNRNEESELINKLDGDSVEIRGSQSIDRKEEILMAFANGEIKRLITKASMTSFGLNWQHCNHTVYFPTYSYEQYYQAIRRFWRFGQKNEVTVDLVISDGQKLVMESLEKKTQKAIELYQNLTKNVNSTFTQKKEKQKNNIKLPSFI
jgi:superfamily II DNA or RNA helicase